MGFSVLFDPFSGNVVIESETNNVIAAFAAHLDAGARRRDCIGGQTTRLTALCGDPTSWISTPLVVPQRPQPSWQWALGILQFSLAARQTLTFHYATSWCTQKTRPDS